MQETHLKKTQKTDVAGTLRSFAVGESECILTVDSQTDISYWRSRYGVLKKKNLLSGSFQFHSTVVDGKEGTLIMRVA